MIKGLAHICLAVNDLDKAEQFYTEKIGLKHGFDFVNEKGKRYGVYLHIGGRNFIELFETRNLGFIDGQSYQHVCIEVEDIELMAEQIRNKGVEVTKVMKGLDHTLQCWLADPEGNKIELHEYAEKSWQRPLLK